MSKKSFHKLFSALLICGFLFGLASRSPKPALAQGMDELRVDLFGYAERTLFAPFDTMDYVFGLPADWILLNGASVQIDLTAFFDRVNVPDSVVEEHGLGGQIQVVFNDKVLTTIFIERNGDQSYNVPIPVEALTPALSEGRHQLVLNFLSEEYCLYGTTSTIIVRPTTRIIIPHQPGSVPTDLTQLPYPIFQRNSFLPSSALLVVPNQPTADELQAAFAVSAALGRMSGGLLQLTLLPVGQFTPEVRGIQHVIFVGKPGGFPVWNEVAWPLSVVEWTNTYPEDGLIHMTGSPWNGTKVVLFVSGSSDAGVIKASQALGSGLIIGNVQPNLALIQQTNPETTQTIAATDVTFAALGYTTETVRRVGVVRREYQFYVPPGMVAGDDAYVKLFYSHSTLLDYETSSLIVSLNNEPIGSARYADETGQQGILQVGLPKSSIRAGVNRLMVEANLIPIDLFANLLTTELWLTIRAESSIHLPLVVPVGGVVSRALDLGLYPDMFSLSPAQRSIAFVLHPADLTAWRVANQISFDLGDNTNWSLAELEVAFADSVPDAVMQERDLFIIGKPSTLPIIAQLGESLPAPFDAGSDLPRTQKLQVVYRVTPGASVGYLELLPTPWNSARAILTVLGNTDEGLLWSGAALTTPGLRGKLAGDFAVIHGEQIVAGNSRFGPGMVATSATPVPGSEYVPVVSCTVTPRPRPAWVLPALAAVVIVLIVVLILVLFGTWRQSRRRPGL